ncbi:hypothetical protein F4801DRAFT_595847 [Xylaria longipes]|nr:hypothetical protein F4801DRAFT_595847 [Xylaria longipes]
MVHYRPLDTSRKEIRVIHPRPAGPSNLVSSSKLEYTPWGMFPLMIIARRPRHISNWTEQRSRLSIELCCGIGVHKATREGRATLRVTRVSRKPRIPTGHILQCDNLQWGDFYVLSCEWGGPGDTDEITVDVENTTIFRTLKDALQRLYITCMADVIERNYQVGRMQQIYSTAIKVLIMTGPGVEDPQATCELLGRSFRATLQGYASPEDTRIFLNEDAIHVTPDYRLPPSEVH